MHVLLGIALKSLLVAGLTLGLLKLLHQRSAAERSWVAHIGLLALVIVAFAPLALPNWNVETPALFGSPESAAVAPPATLPSASVGAQPIAPAVNNIVASAPSSAASLSPLAAAIVLYALPAAILLFITLLALGRLIALRARADVLVDGHWLSALARAQRRMGFKHGTALLTSNELASPISWGLMRPVILLNSRAVEAADEAEAIIAHELAHVARMDWIKLLLARIATALFWFNPLVWVLAREAHQLREEAADDSVLAADIPDTDYAQLLVGVARHECPGLLLGAHGVAPSKSSLARRVARVLDGKSVRGPVARSFAVGVFVGAVLVAAPLAALTLTPAASKKTDKSNSAAAASPSAPYYPGRAQPPSDLARLIADGVSTAVTAVAAAPAATEREARAAAIADAVANATRARDAALARATATESKVRATVPGRVLDDDALDGIIELKANGVTTDYVQAMRAAVPSLRSLDAASFAGLKAVGARPEWAREMSAVGFRDLAAEELTSARAVGLSADYARGLAAAGVPPEIDSYIQLRAVGVPLRYVTSIRKAGVNVRDVDRIVQMWALGVKPGEVTAAAPKPSRRPRAPLPPDWDPFDRDTDPNPDD